MALTKIDDRGLKTPIDLLDNEKIRLGTGNDLEIYHNGTNSYINNGEGDLWIKSNGDDLVLQALDDILIRPQDGENGIKVIGDGAVELYYNNTKTFETTAAGATFDTGSSSCVVKLTSNTDAETVLQGYNSDFYLKAPSSGDVITQVNGNEDAIKALANGAVELYYNNSKKFETTSGGATLTGSLGINTTSPQKLLDVRGEFAISNSNSSYWDFDRDDSDGSLKIKDTGTERMRIDSSGRLLVGTTTEGHTSADDLTISTSSGPAGITLRSSSTEGGRIFFSDGTSGAAEYRGVVGYDHSANYMYFSTDASEAMRIDSDGHVMIGTTTEGFATYGDQFTIANSGHCGMTIRSGTSNYGTIYFSDGDDGSAAEVRGFVEYNHSTNVLSLGTDGATHFRIDASGNVGINDTSPVGTLHLKAHTNSWHGGLLLEDPDGNTGWNVHPDNSDDLMIGKNSNTTATSSNVTHIASFNSNGLAFTSGKGIDFSASGNASGMDSELLDDYEEGEHTITTNSNLTLHTSYNKADYTKVGNMVTVTMLILVSSVSGSDTVNISLPFNNKSTSNPRRCDAVGSVMHKGVNTGNVGLIPYLDMNSGSLRLYELNDGQNWLALGNDDLSANDELYITITYKTA